MSAVAAWFAMGGYAAFVWPAYATALAVLGGVALWSWRRHRAAWRNLGRLQREGAAAP